MKIVKDIFNEKLKDSKLVTDEEAEQAAVARAEHPAAAQRVSAGGAGRRGAARG